jgi:hypothetical protein
MEYWSNGVMCPDRPTPPLHYSNTPDSTSPPPWL